MAFAGNCGLDIDLYDSQTESVQRTLQLLFAEELDLVYQVENGDQANAF